MLGIDGRNWHCKDVISEIQRQLGLLYINIHFDSISVIKSSFEKGTHIVYLNAIDSLSEREKYEKKTDAAKEKYKTKSPCIHFPDIDVGELVETYQCGIEDEFSNTVAFYRNRGTFECSDEIGFACFLFLHEAGHWDQLRGYDRLVRRFIEMNIEEERNNHDAQIEIIQKAMKRNGVNRLGKPLEFLDNEKVRLRELQVEYRNIPKEAEADRYALVMLKKLDFETMKVNLLQKGSNKRY